MSSRPFLQAVNAKIESLGGDEWVFDRIADGVPMRKIADEVGCSRPFLYNWRDQAGPQREARREGWAEAMKRSAMSKAEDGERILEEVGDKVGLLVPVDVQLATSRANYALKMAELRDPEAFGKGKGGPQVVLNIGQLHLDALRQVGSMSQAPVVAQLEAGETHDADLVEAGEGGE